jgi:hypothetical protein
VAKGLPVFLLSGLGHGGRNIAEQGCLNKAMSRLDSSIHQVAIIRTPATFCNAFNRQNRATQFVGQVWKISISKMRNFSAGSIYERKSSRSLHRKNTTPVVAHVF